MTHRTKTETETFSTAIREYGEANQLIVLFEEMSELQKEVCKAIRYSKVKQRNAIAEECADVEIMLEQLKMIFDIDDDVEGWRLDKVCRLQERLGITGRHIGGD